LILAYLLMPDKRKESAKLGILFNQLTEYGSADIYPYHMPGHKRRSMEGFPREITGIDITEISGFDNLHQPEGVLLEAQIRAAAAYGAEESFYLINGSSCGILSAVSAAVPIGGHLLIARNCHKSVYHAAYLRQLKLSYIYPEISSEFDICEAVTATQIEKRLQADSSIQAVLIVSPTYEGRIADVEAIAKVVHARGIPLIVDEAHGAHLGFENSFAKNSSRLGADLVINSTHKTLQAMTQTALLHCNGCLVDREALKRFLRIYQSSSPSYVLMASIDHAVQTAVTGGEAFGKFREMWMALLQQLGNLKKIRVLPDWNTATDVHDVGKLILSVKNTNVSGKELMDILREKYQLEMEMACETYVLAMFTVADVYEGYERLIQALTEVDEELEFVPQREILRKHILWPAQSLPFYQAWDRPKRSIPLEEAAGCIAGDFINLYPPGTPIVVPGEILEISVIQKIQNCLRKGLEVSGVEVSDSGSLSGEPRVTVLMNSQ